MAKIPFNIKYRPQIESGEYKVEVAEGYSVHIVYWDAKRENGACICGFMGKEEDEPYFWQPNGSWWSDGTQSPLDLLIVTPEKLTPFEQSLKDRFFFGELAIETQELKEIASELLSLAREQLVKDGYVIEKEAFLDAVKKVSPEIMKEVSKNVDMQIALRTEYEKGRADALKGLPRWKSFRRNSQDYPFFSNCEDGENCLVFDGKCIKMCELLKLPGFKEDE